MALKFTLNRIGLLQRTSTHLFSFGRTMAEHPIKDIKFDDLKTKLDSKEITLIDVREPKELKEDGKIPHSVNIPLGEIGIAFKLPETAFKSKYGFSKPDESDAFVISCRSGKRATNAFNNLQPLGYKNAFVYTGSFLDWVKNGGVVLKD